MHLVIWSSLRSGSHMLRSMLAADPRVLDVGEFLADPDRYRALLEQHRGTDRIVLSNPKWGWEGAPIDRRVRSLQEFRARVILLHRRDLLAQQASWALAASTGAFREVPAPAGATVTLQPERVGRAMFYHALQLEQVRLALQPVAHVELAYEDISRASVVAALETLGLDLDVAEPATRKSAPPRLADFVTNLSELI